MYMIVNIYDAHIPGTITLYAFTHLKLSKTYGSRCYYYYAHFTHEKTEA